MKLTRQQVLLSLLLVIAAVQVGDWGLNTLIQGPLQERRAKTAQLKKDIRSREKQLADLRAAGSRVEEWLKQSLPADPETSRTAYRSWLLALLRTSQLADAVVDSGSVGSRRLKNGEVLTRSLPFTLRARGSLAQFNNFLFRFTRAGLLHQITGFSLTPVSGSALFDLSVSIDTLLLPNRKGNDLNPLPGTQPALPNATDYAAIASQNVFGVGLNTVDPLRHTFVSAITFSNGQPLVWITEELSSRVTRTGPGEAFTTAAMSGAVREIREREVVVETSGRLLVLTLGSTFAEAKPVTP
jgi:Tfp pilus assembly protein PilO